MEGVNVAILCGGPGTRLQSGATAKQKCMLEVGGKPVLKHVLDSIVEAFRSAKVKLITAYRAPDIMEYFGAEYRALAIEYIHRPQVVGTRRALLDAQRTIHSDFLMMHGDVLCSAVGLQQLQRTFQRQKPDAALLVATRQDAASTHGLVAFRESCVSRLEYPPTHSLSAVSEGRYMGVDWFSASFFRELERVDTTETISGVLQELIATGRDVRAVPYEMRWFHFATPEDLNVTIQFGE